MSRITWIFAFFLFAAAPALAADVRIVADDQAMSVGETARVQVLLGSPEERVNAIEGRIAFPGDLLELVRIEDGNSVILFWAERAQLEDGAVVFSGIIPGGYQGTDGNAFRLVFKAIAEGTAAVEAKDVRVLKNDGLGTPAEVRIAPLAIEIDGFAADAPSGTGIQTDDREPPEPFAVELTRDPSIFGGAWFLAFATQDKGVGIDRYEICEGRRKCVAGESPYLLQNQRLSDAVTVTAIDRNGNTRTVNALTPHGWSGPALAVAIILILGTAVAVLLGKKFLKPLWRK